MKILIIDDEPSFRLYLASILEDVFRYQVVQAGSFSEATGLEEEVLSSFDLAFIDMQMPLIDGFQAGKKLKQQYPSIVTIMLTAYPTIEKVIIALRDHQFDDFLIKEDLEDVQEFTQLKNALLRSQKLSEIRKALSAEYRLSDMLRNRYASVQPDFIGQSESFDEVKRLIKKVAPGMTTVLVTGETGTGKELVAREIHRMSSRGSKVFVPINCSAIPYGLLESELFGHKKGSFTGAVGDRAGYFKLADGGTLLLDEVGDMPSELQTKLLRVLEEKQFFPVGSNKLSDAVNLDVRIISATHQNLEEKMKTGQFRRDLFYRLNTFILKIPPLRDRTDDIEPLVGYFISRNGAADRIKGISSEALDILKQWPWPGNVRELQNLTERAVLLCNNDYLQPRDFPEEVRNHASKKIKFEPATMEGKAGLEDPISGIVVLPESASTNPSLNNEGRTADHFWNSFRGNNFKLWTFDEPDNIRSRLKSILQNAKYLKKGHSGRLVVIGDSVLELHTRFINGETGELDHRLIRFRFQTEKERDLPGKKDTNDNTCAGDVIVQPIYKGLPDTYLFNLLYPVTRKNRLVSHNPQRIVRATVLRYALEENRFTSLKSVFDRTMSMLIDKEVAEGIEGLTTWGLEAVRAYLCGADHIFAGLASQLKNEPDLVRKELSAVFTNYSNQIS